MDAIPELKSSATSFKDVDAACQGQKMASSERSISRASGHAAEWLAVGLTVILAMLARVCGIGGGLLGITRTL
eukprot:7397894-Prorocentrum_lima.AAC.1